MRESEMGDVGVVLGRALGGDELAWNSLVRGLSVIILRIAKEFRLDAADASDLCQDTWLSFSRCAASLRDPGGLPGWLATTARRHALRALACRDKENPTAEAELARPSAEAAALGTDQARALWLAAARLPLRSRRLLWLLAHRPELTHAEIAAELGIRPGSVGPLRRRCLDRMRAILAEGGYECP
jgi:RNA polymerase sigma factor (sigma-70 family)